MSEDKEQQVDSIVVQVFDPYAPAFLELNPGLKRLLGEGWQKDGEVYTHTEVNYNVTTHHYFVTLTKPRQQ